MFYSLVKYRFRSHLKCLPKPLEFTCNGNETLACYKICQFTVIYKSEMFYSLIKYGFRSHLKCLIKPLEVTCNDNETLPYYRICPFTVLYKSVMFLV